MITKHESISVGVYWNDIGIPGWKLSGYRAQGQQSVLKIAKSTFKVHLVWNNIYIPTETGRQMWAVMYYSICLCKSNCERARDLCCDAHILTQ
jgi:hypothetical protein